LPATTSVMLEHRSELCKVPVDRQARRPVSGY
jgi:hypothetical protein